MMITANTIRQYAYLDSLTLQRLIQKSYPFDVVLLSEFIGINSDEQFIYTITYPDQLRGRPCTARICVWENDSGEMAADYACW
jgi:hypothetical protein